MDGLALTISLGLQYGVPLKVFVDKLVNTRFEPSGISARSEHPVRHVGAGLHRALAGRKVHFVGLYEAERNDDRGQSRFGGLHNSVAAGTAAAPRTSEPMSYSPRDAHEGGANLLRVRHADGAERSVLQVRRTAAVERFAVEAVTGKREDA